MIDKIETQTNIDKVIILSTENLIDSKTALSIYKYIKDIHKKRKIGAVSLEVDRNLQGYLNTMMIERKNFSFGDFPGLGYLMNYCVVNKIPLYSTDSAQQEYLRGVENANRIFEQKVIKNCNKNFEKHFKIWKDTVENYDNIRAKNMARELKKLSKKIEGKIYHVGTNKTNNLLISYL